MSNVSDIAQWDQINLDVWCRRDRSGIRGVQCNGAVSGEGDGEVQQPERQGLTKQLGVQ